MLMKTIRCGILLAALGCGGCGSFMSQFAGEWGQFSKHRNDVTAIKAGMRVSEVITAIGKPHQTEEGDNIYIGWQQWIYPTGSILVYRGVVKSVHALPQTQEVAEKLAEANKKGFEFGFEDAKKSTKIEEEKTLEKNKRAAWGVNTKVKQNPYARSQYYENDGLEGFSMK